MAWRILKAEPATTALTIGVVALGVTAGGLAAVLGAGGAFAPDRLRFATPLMMLSDGATRTPTGLLAIATSLGGMALTATLAGSALLTGVQRRRADLALLEVNGASLPQVRGVVLRQGLLVGVAGSLVGSALTVAVAIASLPTLRLRNAFADIAVATIASAGLGIMATVLAAGVPARRLGRDDLPAALAGRSPRRVGRQATPFRLLAMPATAALAVALGHAASNSATSPAVFVLGLGAALMALVAVIAGAEAVARSLAGRGGRLRPTLRFSLRDLAHQSQRSAATIVAIAAVATAATALLAVLAMQRHDETLGWPDEAGRHWAEVGVPAWVGYGDLTTSWPAPLPPAQSVRDRLADIGVADTFELPTIGTSTPIRRTRIQLEGPNVFLPGTAATVLTDDLRERLGLPGDVDANTVLVPRRLLEEEIERELERGPVSLVTRRLVLQEASVDPDRGSYSASWRVASRRAIGVTVRVVDAPFILGQPIVTSALATAIGLTPTPSTTAVLLARAPANHAEVEAVQGRFAEGMSAPEPGWSSSGDRIRLLGPRPDAVGEAARLGGAVLLFALLVAMATSRLAASESDRFVAALVTLGADPRERRRLHAIQAALHTAAGAATGCLLAFVGLAVVGETAGRGMPWWYVPALVFGVPVAVGLVGLGSAPDRPASPPPRPS